MNIANARKMITTGKIPNGGLRTRSTFRGYVAAVAIQSLLFIVSWKIRGESEVLFTLIYVFSGILIAVFGGRGAGILAGILAAFSVDYHYIHPVGSLFNTAQSILFLIITLLIIQFTINAVQFLLELINHSEKARSELETAVHDREELLAIVAHDLRQPLAGLALKLQMSARNLNLGKILPTERLLSDGQRILDRMDFLIQDLLDGARIDSGKLNLVVDEGDLEAICMETFEFFIPEAARKDVKFEFHRPAETLNRIQFDALRISRVLSNLICNALKFTPAKGEVALSVRNVGSDSVEVRVRDTGPGISAEDVDHLFQRHWQAAETAHLGTGLGLYICRGIIDAHRGRIWYEPKLGGGATFCFQLSAGKERVCTRRGADKPLKVLHFQDNSKEGQ